MSERMMIRNKISCFFVEIEDNIVDDGDDGWCLLVTKKKCLISSSWLAGDFDQDVCYNRQWARRRFSSGGVNDASGGREN